MSIEQSRDPKQFAAFELSGWDSNIGGYDAAFGAVTRQTVRAMLDAARVARGMRVLDVCSGPGMLAAGALECGAEAIGLDFSLRQSNSPAGWCPTAVLSRGDAQALPYRRQASMRCSAATGSCTSRNPLRQCAKCCAYSALVAEQRSAFGINWRRFCLVYEAVRARGSMDVALPHGPDYFQFGSPERMRAALVEAGFADTDAQSFQLDWHVANTDRYIESILTGTVRARAVLAAQSGAAAGGVRSYIGDYLTRFRAPTGEFVIPMPAIIGSGARSG